MKVDMPLNKKKYIKLMQKFKRLNIFLEVERGECDQTEELPLKSIFTHTNHKFLQDCFTHLKPVPPIADILSCYGGLIKTAFEFFENQMKVICFSL